mmetsp:Transcript_6774/g.14832  ORF Transcript_6774/g.14832 Transcript_6774/m.14832 type:complete len:259 (+) Transcript_6774:145-921(+)
MEGRHGGQPGLPQNGAQPQPGDCDGGPRDHRRGGGARERGRDRAGRGAHAGRLRAARRAGREDGCHREAHACRRRVVRLFSLHLCCGRSSRAHRAARGARAPKRRLRQFGHRDADPRLELHTSDGEDHTPVRERHARCRAFPKAREGGLRPDQRGKADGDRACRGELLWRRPELCDDPWGALPGDRAWVDAGGGEWRHGQLLDPGQARQGDGWRDGSGLVGIARHRHHGAHGQGGQLQGASEVHIAADGPRRGLDAHY